jgi:hypothetical protein
MWDDDEWQGRRLGRHELWSSWALAVMLLLALAVWSALEPPDVPAEPNAEARHEPATGETVLALRSKAAPAGRSGQRDGR